MSELVNLYEKYYAKRTSESVEDLFKGLIEYDFSDYWSDINEIHHIHQNFLCENEEFAVLHTNGSTTGCRRPYQFGPHFNLWASKIERYLRNKEEGKTIFLYSRIGNGPGPKKLLFSNLNNNNKKDYDTNADFSQNKQIEELFVLISKISLEFGNVNLSSFPDVWNMLFSNPYFNQMCILHKDKIGCCVNNDFEMFFTNEKLYVRDQMINWASGLNFFVCKSGIKHFIPIFHVKNQECVNLINLAGKPDESDSISLHNETKECKCGKRYIPIDIIFHKGNNVLNKEGHPTNFQSLAKLISGRYLTFQVHQDENEKISIFLTTKEKNLTDEEKIRSFFSGQEIEILKDRYFEIGSKRYCFWRSNDLDWKHFKV